MFRIELLCLLVLFGLVKAYPFPCPDYNATDGDVLKTNHMSDHCHSIPLSRLETDLKLDQFALKVDVTLNITFLQSEITRIDTFHFDELAKETSHLAGTITDRVLKLQDLVDEINKFQLKEFAKEAERTQRVLKLQYEVTRLNERLTKFESDLGHHYSKWADHYSSELPYTYLDRFVSLIILGCLTLFMIGVPIILFRCRR